MSKLVRNKSSAKRLLILNALRSNSFFIFVKHYGNVKANNVKLHSLKLKICTCKTNTIFDFGNRIFDQ